MMMMGMVFCTSIGAGMTPIAHVFPLMAMGYYTTATGATITYAQYMAMGVPAGIVCALLMLAVFLPLIAGLWMKKLQEKRMLKGAQEK